MVSRSIKYTVLFVEINELLLAVNFTTINFTAHFYSRTGVKLTNLNSEIPLETMLFPILTFVTISASSSWNKTLATPSPTPVFV